MSLRVLYIFDWYFGVFIGSVFWADEQAAFLDWLLETLAAREVDALVLAGDVFDSMHPPAEAFEFYYSFLV